MSEKSIVPQVVGEEEVLARPIQECLTPKLTELLFDLPDELRRTRIEDLELMIDPTVMMRRIKISFWDEYRKTIDQGRKAIDLSSVCRELCSREYFYEYVAHKNEVFAWLFHPPTGFDKKAEEALDYGIDKVREILTAPLFVEGPNGSRGAFLKDNAAVILNAVKFLDARVKGSPLQRIEQKSLHVHKNADSVHKGISREELDAEIRALGQRLGDATLQIVAPDETE